MIVKLDTVKAKLPTDRQAEFIDSTIDPSRAKQSTFKAELESIIKKLAADSNSTSEHDAVSLHAKRLLQTLAENKSSEERILFAEQAENALLQIAVQQDRAEVKATQKSLKARGKSEPRPKRKFPMKPVIV